MSKQWELITIGFNQPQWEVQWISAAETRITLTWVHQTMDDLTNKAMGCSTMMGYDGIQLTNIMNSQLKTGFRHQHPSASGIEPTKYGHWIRLDQRIIIWGMITNHDDVFLVNIKVDLTKQIIGYVIVFVPTQAIFQNNSFNTETYVMNNQLIFAQGMPYFWTKPYIYSIDWFTRLDHFLGQL